MLYQRRLQRTRNASEIPAIDYVIARAICKLMLAQDRRDLEPAFFSRAVAACNGSFVWPEAVLRFMEKTQPNLDREKENKAKPQKKASLNQIRLNTGLIEAPWIKSCALVDENQTLSVRSTCFSSFSMDAPMRSSVAQATLAWLAEADDPSDSIPVLRNSQFMANAFGMDEACTELFKFMCLVMHSEAIKLVLRKTDCHFMSTGVEILSRWVGSSHSASVEQFFADNGALVQLGMHRGFKTDPMNLEDVVRLRNPSIMGKLECEHANESAFLDSFLNASCPPKLCASDFLHLSSAKELHHALLTNASVQRTRGINFLLYGQPGTGKTEYARSLAESAGVKLYEIESTDAQGASTKPGQRLGMLMVTLLALQHHTHAAILFDEAEDFFEPSSRGDSRVFNSLSKAWLNQFLENTAVPVIWTSNEIRQIDPSSIRRFTVLHEFKSPPNKVRTQIALKHFERLGLELEDIQRIAALPGLTPAQIETTAKAIELAAPIDSAQARIWTHQHLATSRRALGLPSDVTQLGNSIAFDPQFLNIRNGPNMDMLLRQLNCDPAVSLCLYGLPGTGKTELAKYIAEQLGRELVVKTGSDLLSKWVGDTEQKIAAMFESCADHPQDSILLLDEADTFLRSRQSARNSWEVSHTNEFLARMTQFSGTFICTTNLFEELDTAALRRFQFRIQFDAMKQEQVVSMFEASFGQQMPAATTPFAGLVPADFANVKRQLKYMNGELTPLAIQEMLRVEAATRQGQSRTSAPMGFL